MGKSEGVKEVNGPGEKPGFFIPVGKRVGECPHAPPVCQDPPASALLSNVYLIL